METKTKFFNRPTISLPKQGELVKQTYPTFTWSINDKGWLVCVGDIQPTSLSVIYRVKISYTVNKKPIIEIVSPKLNGYGKKIPHTYADKTLCLYRPKYNEWSKYDCIADKIIPWISLWLYYYEVWLITDEWVGGGEHPEPNKYNKNKSLKMTENIGLSRIN